MNGDFSVVPAPDGRAKEASRPGRYLRERSAGTDNTRWQARGITSRVGRGAWAAEESFHAHAMRRTTRVMSSRWAVWPNLIAAIHCSSSALIYSARMKSGKGESAIKWGLRVHVLWYIVANVIQVVLWATLTRDQFFWPLWSIVGWGIGLAFHIRGANSHLKALSGT
ncbi:2TM domain-containing protein [Pseudofrankia sp. BMG5.37]|nr:2TM domain-containing protein [Pseudofrankia sp. BMG5.37]